MIEGRNMKISLIIPCYNEELNIQKGVLDKIGNYTRDNAYFGEVLIVDDGSTDESKKIVREKYLRSFPKFKLVENNHKGKAFAVIAGIEKSKEEFVMFSDMDLATPIEEAQSLIDKALEGNKIIIGSRHTREGAPLLRKVMARAAILVQSMIIGLHGIKDTQCGFKLFEKKAAISIIKKLRVFHNNRNIEGSSVSAGFDMEFLFLATKLKLTIQETPVEWKHVETKHVNFLKDSFEGLKDIFLIKYYDLTGRYA